MKKPSLKDMLFLGFCAALIVVTKMALRLHLGVPGHVMLFTIFFLMLARASVGYVFAASFTGLLAGLASVGLGLGKGGPLILFKFILPAFVIDLTALFATGIFTSYLLCVLVAAFAASTKFMDAYLIDTLMGMDKGVTLRHAALQTLGAVLFGTLGGLLVPPVVKKLRSRGVI